MSGLVLNKINKAFGDVHIIRDLDLQIVDGEFVVFVGPSGCGKSTLLRLIAGLEEASGGEIIIDNNLVNDLPPKDRGIGMVFQSYALYPHMTVYENIAFGLKLSKNDKDDTEQRVKRTAEILQLSALADRKPRNLSGGQRQRVAIGRAMAREPKIMLFDEPLSNLDAALRVQMRAEIGKLHERLKSTMIYVTHDQVEAMTLADKIVVLNAGRVEQVGTPQELYDHPETVFVASFIGSMDFDPRAVAAANTATSATSIGTFGTTSISSISTLLMNNTTGYIRDGCVWSEDIDIYDKMGAQIRYANGVHVSYSCTTYSPYEGYRIAFNGTEGRLEAWVHERQPWPAESYDELRVTDNFGKTELIKISHSDGGHGGGDTRMQDRIFRNVDEPDPYRQVAGVRDGAMAALLGIAARKSVETSQPVHIADLTSLVPKPQR